MLIQQSLSTTQKQIINQIQIAENIKVEQQIGSGLSGTIYRAQHPNNHNVSYAVKVFKFVSSSNSNSKERLNLQYQMEVNVLNFLQNESYIIRILSNGRYQNFAYIVLEYCQMQSLRYLKNCTCQSNCRQNNEEIKKQDKDLILENKRNSNIQQKKRIKKFMSQLLYELSKFQEHGLIHHDIKLQNLLLDNQHHLKIIDFSSVQVVPMSPQDQAKISNQFQIEIRKINKILNEKNDFLIGSKHYICPQLISGKRKRVVSTKIDIWSFGVALYKALCNKFPFQENNPLNISGLYRKIRQQQIQFPSYLSDTQIQIINRCLKKNPIDRPSAKELFNFKYFDQIDWKSISQKSRASNQNNFRIQNILSKGKQQQNKDKILIKWQNKSIIYFVSKKMLQSPSSSLTNLSSDIMQDKDLEKQTKKRVWKKFRNVSVQISQTQYKKAVLKITIAKRKSKQQYIPGLKIYINDLEIKFQEKNKNYYFHLKFKSKQDCQQITNILKQNGAQFNSE